MIDQTIEAKLGAGGLLLAAAILAAPCLAQSAAGRISGRVLDPTGAVVAGAQVETQQIETGLIRSTATDSAGEYAFAVLPVGDYQITASHGGFQPGKRQVRLEVGRYLEVNLDLALDVARAALVVTDSTPLVEPGDAARGAVISRETLAELPLNDRAFLQLALLAAGAHPAAPGSELSRQNNSGLHLNGARETSNNFLLDGVDNNDLFINRIVVSPPLDVVREFRLHASGYQAEYGRSGGAQVNVVTQSGGNRLHGSVYEYFRNAALDARNVFDLADRPIPQFQRNQFGGSLGGPIRQDRAFFFVAYEGTRLRQGVTRLARVPTAAQKSAAAPEQIDSIGAALARFWPEPNRADPVFNFVSAPVGSTRADQAFGRFDQHFSPRDTVYARYNFSHDRSLVPFSEGTTNLPGFGSFVINRGQNVAVSETHVWSARTVWEERFGFNRLRREVLQQNIGNDVAGALGIPGLSREPRHFGFPAIMVPGFDPISDNIALPIIRRDNTYHALGSVTHIRGRHTVKTGVEYRQFSADGVNDAYARGQFSFASLAALLAGRPSLTLRTVIDNRMALRASAWNAYAQDDWKLGPRLTVNLGLRYEYNVPATDPEDRFRVFDLEGRALVAPGSSGVPRAGYRGDRNNLAPRFGLSWSPDAASKTVLHGGYGVFYDTTILEANSGLYFNPPYFELTIFFPIAVRPLTLRDPFPTGFGFRPPAFLNGLDPDFRTSYVQHWNFSVEREFAGRVAGRAAYVGSKGTKLLRRRDINQPPPGPSDVNARRPIPGFAQISWGESAAGSVYHSLQLSAERRFRGGLRFSAAYTFSKSIDDASEFLPSTGDQNFPQNSQAAHLERGLSNFDLQHRLVFYGSYDLPAGHHWLLRGWQFHTIGVAQSGPPYTPQLSVDNSNTGNTGGIFGADRPDVAPGGFVTPPRFRFGSAGRNILRGDGAFNLDVALVKTFRWTDRGAVELRAECFNLPNHPNFDLPRRFSDQPGFSVPASAGPSRQIQFSLRLRF